jgi:hypothetical protein
VIALAAGGDVFEARVEDAARFRRQRRVLLGPRLGRVEARLRLHGANPLALQVGIFGVVEGLRDRRHRR